MMEGLEKGTKMAMEGNNAGPARLNSSVTLLDVEDGNTNGQQVQSRAIRRRYFEKCIPLREAAMKGDWQAAKKLIERDRNLCNESITEIDETVFHVAAGAGKTNFFKKLLDLEDINDEALEVRDGNGNTVCYHAVTAGAKAIAEIILERNSRLLTICCYGDMKPLYYAALFGRGEMAIFLYNKMKEKRIELAYKEEKHIFFACMNAHLYDVALELLNDHPELAKARCARTDDTALHFLARDPSAFRSTNGAGKLSGLVKRIKCPRTIGFQLAKCLWDEMKLETDVKEMIHTPKHLLFEAVDKGNLPLVEMIIHSYPDLAWEKNGQFPTIFHAAIKYRRAEIFYLIHNIGSIKNVINELRDDEENTMLHLVARLPHQSRLDLIPGAALQMQQELLWYKEVKKIMEPYASESINRDGKTPEELFMAEHRKLLKDGEQWMKNTAQLCTVVATVIATLVVTISFTMTHGSDKNLFGKFSMFFKFNSVALASSITSILFSFAILISPYSQKEFLNSLLLKLGVSCSMVVISLTSTISAFCIGFMLQNSEKFKSMSKLIVVVNVVPIILFVVLLGPSFWNVCGATLIRRWLGKQKLMVY